jgi:F0F1-type ATP synthase assembly protein I
MNNRVQFIAELTFAGFLVGLLIGPSTLDQFFGLDYDNSVSFNLIVGSLIGAGLGFLGSLLPQSEVE